MFRRGRSEKAGKESQATAERELTAPSPADGPTTEHRLPTAAELAGGSEGATATATSADTDRDTDGRSLSSSGPGHDTGSDATDTVPDAAPPSHPDDEPRPAPVERDTDRLPGGTAGAGPSEPETVPYTGGSVRPTRTTSKPAKAPKPGPGLTRIGGTWVGLIIGAIILIFLLVFIVQNNDPARVYFLGLQAELPLGIWMLFSAIAGVLLLAIPGLGRMVQWRRSTRPEKR